MRNRELVRSAVLATALTLAAPLAAAAPVAAAAEGVAETSYPVRGAVFVQNNGLDGKTVVGYRRLGDGQLQRTGEWATGGRGGLAQDAPFDALASQGSLVHDPHHGLLLAVNAGSGTVSVFEVHGQRLRRTQVLDSGGHFPVGVAVHGDAAYVLNGGGDANVTGFRIDRHGRLARLAASQRELGITNARVPGFLASPGQVGFTPDGERLLVTTKEGGSILGFGVRYDGRLSHEPRVTRLPGAVPFSFDFDRRGRLLLTEAARSRIISFEVTRAGALRRLDTSAPSGGEALCWNVVSGPYVFGANSASDTLSTWRVDREGDLRQLGGTGSASARGDGAPLDMDVTPDGDHLYVLNALTGTVQGWSVGPDGSLELVERVGGLPRFDAATGGAEGLVAL